VIWRSLFLTVLFLNFSALAGELKLSGNMTQGGLVVGWAAPGAQIKLDGKTINQAKSGDFLLGFGRNAKRSAELNVQFKDGSVEKRNLEIKQRDYKIQRIDGLPKRKVMPNAQDLSRIKKERVLINAARRIEVSEALFAAGFVRPVAGPVSGVYGSQRILNGQPRKPHYGLDIAAPLGRDIKATSAGVVVFAHEGMFFNGKTVVINHGLGLRSTYIHMSALNVKAGDQVVKGQTIGKIGKTGRATGPHLHWGLTLNTTPLDPQSLLK
jgi:murein DD-endopeptidase MepM/ murein hydrolase activator NlpD